MKQKILIITACLRIGGAEKVARDIALYGDRDRYEYHYVVFGKEIGAYEPQLEAIGCKIFHLTSPSRGYRAYCAALAALIREHRYHAVHAHTMFSCGWPMLTARRLGVPVRITHSHSALDDGKSPVKTIYEKIMRRLILSCSTHLVACGEKAGIRLFGESAYRARGRLILNGIDTDAFRYDPQARERIRQMLGMENAFLLGHAGHLAGVKNQKFLIDLMPRLLETEPRARLCLLGEGSDRPMLEARIRELGLEGRVILTGNVANVADYLSAMDVFVFPSLYEGTPLAILEVQSNGLPCVLSTGVPKDVHLTDLIRPLSLQAPVQEWVDTILACRRRAPEGYSAQMKQLGFGVETAINTIHLIYKGE